MMIDTPIPTLARRRALFIYRTVMVVGILATIATLWWVSGNDFSIQILDGGSHERKG
jgi:hypothetical protein